MHSTHHLRDRQFRRFEYPHVASQRDLEGRCVVTTPTVTETRRAGQTNERVELARYTVSAGERVIHGQRILGVVRLADNPASGEGRRYVIERELVTMAELEAIVTDYLQQADTWDAIPAAGPCCLLAELAEQDR
jgi:hypothetical protein